MYVFCEERMLHISLVVSRGFSKVMLLCVLHTQCERVYLAQVFYDGGSNPFWLPSYFLNDGIKKINPMIF